MKFLCICQFGDLANVPLVDPTTRHYNNLHFFVDGPLDQLNNKINLFIFEGKLKIIQKKTLFFEMKFSGIETIYVRREARKKGVNVKEEIKKKNLYVKKKKKKKKNYN